MGRLDSLESGTINCLRRYFRLLPVVLAVGVAVLAIKGVDRARRASARSQFGRADNDRSAPAIRAQAIPVPILPRMAARPPVRLRSMF